MSLLMVPNNAYCLQIPNVTLAMITGMQTVQSDCQLWLSQAGSFSLFIRFRSLSNSKQLLARG